MNHTGTIKKYFQERGFGWIGDHDVPGVDRDVFVHCREIIGAGRHEFVEGDLVSFQVQDSQKGLRAVKVRINIESPGSSPVNPNHRK